jgi:peroxiredoxin Q/BCP
LSDTLNLLAAGTEAPDFNAEASDGTSVSLQDFRGEQAVLLMFYPEDDTPGCTRQMCAARDEADVYRQADIVRFGVGPGTLESHRHFVEKYGLDFRLLVDQDGQIARAYGALKENGGVARATYLINKQGQIVFAEPGAHSAVKILEDLHG